MKRGFNVNIEFFSEFHDFYKSEENAFQGDLFKQRCDLENIKMQFKNSFCRFRNKNVIMNNVPINLVRQI